MTEQRTDQQRTLSQNDSIHLYLSWVAKELQNRGETIQGLLKRIKKFEIIPTTKNLKEVLWRTAQEAQVRKKSSTQLTKQEVDEVYQVIAMFLAKEYGIDLPFPHNPDKTPEEKAGVYMR